MAFEIYHKPTALKAIQKRLDQVSGPGSGRLARNIQYILVEGNREDRLRGVDSRGRPLVPWRVRVGRYAGRTGPTLAPRGTASDVIAGYFARIFNQGQGWRIRCGIKSPKAYIFAFHAEGKSGRWGGGVTGIRRSVLGTTPWVRSLVLNEFKTFARMKGQYR